MMDKKVLAILFLVVMLLLFYKYGRSIYMPLIQKLKGKETISTIISKIENGAFNRLKQPLHLAGYDTFPTTLILLGLKEEQILKVYGKAGDTIVFIKEYPFTALSGTVGPKLRAGDKQIPEGIYKVEYLNPNSAYYLSLKVNYPNEYDKSKCAPDKQKNMGGDIFIHGKASSIGCIAIGDDAIEEVFLMVHKAFINEVKVIISPKDFRKDSRYPVIGAIDWEQELYEMIETEVIKLPNNN